MRNKIVLSIVIFIALIINLTGCSPAPSDIKKPNKDTTLNDIDNSVQSNKENPTETDNKNTDVTTKKDSPESPSYIDTKESVYIFINGLFLGSYDNQGWYSNFKTNHDFQSFYNAAPQEGENIHDDSFDFYAKDILNNDAFYVYRCNYENTEFIAESKQIVWPIESIFNKEGNEQKEIEKYCEPYDNGRKYYYSPKIFTLPVVLGTEVSNITLPDSGFYTHFEIEKKVEWKKGGSELVTNKKLILSPRTFTSDGKPTNEGIEALNLLFKNNNMENTIPNFTNTVIGDFDNDGKDEYLMIANSPRIDSSWPAIVGEGKKDKVGTFSAIFYQDDDGSIQTLHQDIRPMEGTVEFTNGIIETMDILHYHEVELGIIAYLNGNGLMEINTYGSYWEMHNETVYSQNSEGVYDAELQSYSFTNGPMF